jgi:hypothetical protein
MPQPPSAEELTRWHRWFAVESNNRAWQLADQTERTAADDDEMLNAAHAAATANDANAHHHHYAAARAAGDVIADAADRTIFEATFARIPAP